MLKGESYGNANCVFFVCHGNMFHGMGRVLSSSVSELTKDQSNIKTSYICWFNISLLGTVQFDKNVSMKPTTWWGGFSSDISETWGVYCLLGTAHILRKVLCLVPRMCRGDREVASPFPLQVCIYQNRIFFMHGLEILDLDMKIAYTFTSYSVFGVTAITYLFGLFVSCLIIWQ